MPSLSPNKLSDLFGCLKANLEEDLLCGYQLGPLLFGEIK
jgi:hypothetical protein